MSGWADLDGVNVIPLDKKRDDIDILIAKTFSTDEGKKVLSWLHDKYLKHDKKTWLPGAEASFGYWRAGQNDVIEDLLMRIEKTKG